MVTAMKREEIVLVEVFVIMDLEFANALQDFLERDVNTRPLCFKIQLYSSIP